MGAETLTLADGRTVLMQDYITAKTKDLRESYADLTEEDVAEQLEYIMNGEALSVIGYFMKDDIA